MKKNINIQLDSNEALILFSFINKVNKNIEWVSIEGDSRQLKIDFKVWDEVVLDSILCDLEEKLVEPFYDDFDKIIEKTYEKYFKESKK